MIKLIIGFILGVVVATVGFTGLAKMADKGVAKVQEVSKEATKSDTLTDIKDTAKDVAKKAIDQVAK